MVCDVSSQVNWVASCSKAMELVDAGFRLAKEGFGDKHEARHGSAMVFMSCVSTGLPGAKSSDQVKKRKEDGRQVARKKVRFQECTVSTRSPHQPEKTKGGRLMIDYRLVALLPQTLGIGHSEDDLHVDQGEKCSVKSRISRTTAWFEKDGLTVGSTTPMPRPTRYLMPSKLKINGI